MYGGSGHGYEAEQEEFLKQQQQGQSSQYNFNYYDSSATMAPPSTGPSTLTPEYPTASAQSQFNQFSHSASTGSAAGMTGGGMTAFDNIDISRGGPKFSGGTPFETVHEFVSVSNKVTSSIIMIVILNISFFCLVFFRNFKTFWILLLLILDHVG